MPRADRRPRLAVTPSPCPHEPVFVWSLSCVPCSPGASPPGRAPALSEGSAGAGGSARSRLGARGPRPSPSSFVATVGGRLGGDMARYDRMLANNIDWRGTSPLSRASLALGVAGVVAFFVFGFGVGG